MLNREPMGMKPVVDRLCYSETHVSVLNREPMGMKPDTVTNCTSEDSVSVLNREPMGMKRGRTTIPGALPSGFSAQPRADGDEALVRCDHGCYVAHVSVLNREPMGMKRQSSRDDQRCACTFQCSTASRWG